MKTKKSIRRTRFGGTVLQLSISGHGETEGVMLDTNSFVKIPPHSVLLTGKIKVGSVVSGSGVEIADRPNSVFYHAQVVIGKKLVADDSGHEKARTKSKEVHQARLKASNEKVVEKKTIAVARIAGIAVKPKGEVDRMLLSDGTSAHMPKELELKSKDFNLGDLIQLNGKGRTFGKNKFLHVKTVTFTKNEKSLR